MAQLDVIVINAHTFEKAALIQIAGRVGRKQGAPTGKVIFMHEGVSIAMIQAKEIKNESIRYRTWVGNWLNVYNVDYQYMNRLMFLTFIEYLNVCVHHV